MTVESGMRIVTCAVCDSAKYRPFLNENGYEVVTCLECGHLYTRIVLCEEKYSAAYQESRDWLKEDSPNDASGSAGRFRVYENEIVRLLDSGSTILEIGCSKGLFLKSLQEKGYRCYGVEPSLDAQKAQMLLGKEFVYHGFYSSPIPIDADLVAMFEVLEHIPDPQKTVRIVRQQLAPGGYFLGSLPNGTFSRLKVWPKRVFRINSFLIPLILDAGNHINYFSCTGLTRMLNTAGFDVVWVRDAPLDFNYTANKFSPILKRMWWGISKLGGIASGKRLAATLFFLAQKKSDP